MTRIAFDTNVLAYIAGVERHVDDGPKIEASRTLLKQLRDRAVLIAAVQVLGELFVVLTRSGASREEARETVLRMAQSSVRPTATPPPFSPRSTSRQATSCGSGTR